jgi:hypothetical protein
MFARRSRGDSNEAITAVIASSQSSSSDSDLNHGESAVESARKRKPCLSESSSWQRPCMSNDYMSAALGYAKR